MIECNNGVFVNPAHIILAREHDDGYRVLECSNGRVFKTKWSMWRIGRAVMGEPDEKRNGLKMLDEGGDNGEA